MREPDLLPDAARPRPARAARLRDRRALRQRGESLLGLVVAVAVLILLLGLVVLSLIAHQRAVASQTSLEVARSHVTRARDRLRSELRYAPVDTVRLATPLTDGVAPAGAYLEVRFRRPSGVDPSGEPILGPIGAFVIDPTVGEAPGMLRYSADIAQQAPRVIAQIDGLAYFRFELGDDVAAEGERQLVYRLATRARLDDGSVTEVGAETGELTVTFDSPL